VLALTPALHLPHQLYTSATGTWLYSGATITSGDQVSAYNRISQYPASRSILCDLIYTAGTAPHAASDQKSGFFNLAYSDGHVSTVKDTILFGGLGSGATVPARWPYTATGPAGKIYSFDDDLDILETEVAGRNPGSQTADQNDTFQASTADPYIYRLENAAFTKNDHVTVPWK